MSSLVSGLLSVLLVLLIFALGYAVGQHRLAARLTVVFGDFKSALKDVKKASTGMATVALPDALPQDVVKSVLAMREAAARVAQAAGGALGCFAAPAAHKVACLRGFVRGLGGGAGYMMLELAEKATELGEKLAKLPSSAALENLRSKLWLFGHVLRYAYTTVLYSGAYVV